VRTRVVSERPTGVFSERDLGDVLEARQAEGPETAFLLTSMLRAAGLTAHPVLLSTRRHGQPEEAYPLLNQFNYVVTYVQADGQGFLLDATDPLRPFSILPERALNHRGWLVREGDPRWISLPTGTGDLASLFVRGRLAADGTLTGTVQRTERGYLALAHRHDAQEGDDGDALVRNAIVPDLQDVTVDSSAIQHATNLTQDLVLTAAFQAPAYAQAGGDFLYLMPLVVGRDAMLVGPENQHPLQRPTRALPVDFAYPRTVTVTTSLMLPSGYAVHEHPESLAIELPGGAASYERRVQASEGAFSMRTTFQLRQTRFAPEAYAQLRTFFDRVVAANAELLVLRRTDAPAPNAEQPVEASSEATSGRR
jgi:hypothetical protein